MKRREREERRRNIVIRGLEVKKRRRWKAVEGMGLIRAELVDVRRLGGAKQKGRENVVVKIGSEENKRGHGEESEIEGERKRLRRIGYEMRER